jgi:hypothetical protein
MKFARYVFLIAGVYGVLVIAPQYFLEEQVGKDYPPPVNHPEYFYGFVGVTLAWQVLYLLIATDPARYRPVMLVAVLAKFSFGAAASVLFARDHIPAVVFGFAMFDLVLAALFVAAYVKVGREPGPPP